VQTVLKFEQLIGLKFLHKKCQVSFLIQTKPNNPL